MTNAETFVALLKANYNTQYCRLTFDKEKQRGTISLSAFDVEFYESANDPAVCVRLTSTRRLKSSAEHVFEVLEQLTQLFNSTD